MAMRRMTNVPHTLIKYPNAVGNVSCDIQRIYGNAVVMVALVAMEDGGDGAVLAATFARGWWFLLGARGVHPPTATTEITASHQQ